MGGEGENPSMVISCEGCMEWWFALLQVPEGNDKLCASACSPFMGEQVDPWWKEDARGEDPAGVFQQPGRATPDDSQEKDIYEVLGEDVCVHPKHHSQTSEGRGSLIFIFSISDWKHLHFCILLLHVFYSL